jgi:hypothetical protein
MTNRVVDRYQRKQSGQTNAAYANPMAENRIEEFMTALGKSLIAMPLISIVGVTLTAATADAEDCLAAPNSAAREGTRWYYQLDLAAQHKCWYMRALNQRAQQAVVTSSKALPASAFAVPIPRPRPSTASPVMALSRAYGVPSSSYPKEIAAKPGATPAGSETAAESTSSIPKESISQQKITSSAAPAPNATPLAGVAIDETSSAISEMHQVAPSPQPRAEAATLAADTGTPVDATRSPTSDIAASQPTATSSEQNAQMAALGSNAAPTVIAPIDGVVSSKHSTTRLSTSSDLRTDDAERAPDVSLAVHQEPPAVATLNARPLPSNALANLLSRGRDRTALSDQAIDNTGMPVKPLSIIAAVLLALVIMSYYAAFRYFLGASSDDFQKP